MSESWRYRGEHESLAVLKGGGRVKKRDARNISGGEDKNLRRDPHFMIYNLLQGRAVDHPPEGPGTCRPSAPEPAAQLIDSKPER